MQELQTKSQPKKNVLDKLDWKDFRLWGGALAACFILFTGWSLTRSALDLNDKNTESFSDGQSRAGSITQAKSAGELAANPDYYSASEQFESADSYYGDYDEAPRSPVAPSAGSSNGIVISPAQTLSTSNQKIIKTAGYVLEADEPSIQAQYLIDLTVNRYQGFVQDSKVSTSEDFWYPERQPVQTAYLLLRVPSGQYEQFRADISQLKDIKILSESLSGNDVTSEYVDLEARIKNLRAEEEQLQQLLSRAETVDDMLKVRNQISYTRGEIERLTSQLKNMESQISYATFNLTINQTREETDPVVEEEPKWAWREVLKKAWNNLIEDYQQLLEDLTHVVVGSLILVPFALTLGLVFLIIRALFRRKKK